MDLGGVRAPWKAHNLDIRFGFRQCFFIAACGLVGFHGGVENNGTDGYFFRLQSLQDKTGSPHGTEVV